MRTLFVYTTAFVYYYFIIHSIVNSVNTRSERGSVDPLAIPYIVYLKRYDAVTKSPTESGYKVYNVGTSTALNKLWSLTSARRVVGASNRTPNRIGYYVDGSFTSQDIDEIFVNKGFHMSQRSVADKIVLANLTHDIALIKTMSPMKINGFPILGTVVTHDVMIGKEGVTYTHSAHHDVRSDEVQALKYSTMTLNKCFNSDASEITICGFSNYSIEEVEVGSPFFVGNTLVGIMSINSELDSFDVTYSGMFTLVWPYVETMRATMDGLE